VKKERNKAERNLMLLKTTLMSITTDKVTALHCRHGSLRYQDFRRSEREDRQVDGRW
jgi:hypothetical protein